MLYIPALVIPRPTPRLEKYRVDRLLGTGGMGAVYLARDLSLDRQVAIKFIAPHMAADESSRRRLLREARAAAALDHPNICSVHEVIDEPNGHACIVMQYVDGQTLAEKLQTGPLGVGEALSIATDVAAALAAAHARGIIHRDVKPQNIIVGPSGHAKLVDFGIAMHSPVSDGAASDTTATSLTAPGVVIGTVPYMSPEQVAQRPLDGRSDLFSLGSVLYECLTGERPFKGASPAEICSRVLHYDPPPVSSLRPGLTERHDDLCQRLLRKDPHQRVQSADELLGMLRGFSGTWIPAPPPRPSRSAFWKLTAGISAAAALLLIGLWQWQGRHATVESPAVQRSYERGVEWVRDGAYDSGRRELNRAISLAPRFVPAYVRLAEACSELDDHRCTQDALNALGTLVPDERRLSADDQIRVRAVRALMLRRLDETVAEYRRLTESKRDDAGAWVDLGRAQELAARPALAKESFVEAIRLNPENAAAHLRLATVLGQMGEKQEALEEFGAAEELYTKSANAEGHTEALLRRGAYLNGLGELKAARDALERARTLAQTLQHRGQLIRAELQLSSVAASEGSYGKAADIAAAAVGTAEDEDLDAVAADGLVDLASALLQARLGEAPDPKVFESIDAHLQRAIRIADRRNAQRIKARANIQRVALLAHFGQPEKGLALANDVMEFLRTNGYQRYELRLLLIMSRTLEYLGRHEEGRRMSEEGLRIAEQINDPSETAFALENLAGFATVVGDLPAAEAYRKRGEAINRKQNKLYELAFDLTNRAELLVRIGRSDEAEALLSEVDTQAARGVESFRERQRRATALRALRAAVTARDADVVRFAEQLLSAPAGMGDSSGRLAVALLTYARARQGHRIPEKTWAEAAAAAKGSGESRYWTVYARLLSGGARDALTGAMEGLASSAATASPELEWRLAALGAAAARHLSNHERAETLSERAAVALSRTRATWQNAWQRYANRADIADLLRSSQLGH